MATKKAPRRPRSARQVAEAVERGERRVDRILSGLAGEVASVVAGLGDRPISAGDWAPLMVGVDRKLAAVYGSDYGASSALEEAITSEAAATRRAVATDAVKPLEVALTEADPGLLREIQRAADKRRVGG